VDDESLKGRFQEATRRRDRTDCPVADDLSELASGALAGARREAVLDHAAWCHDCSLEVQSAIALFEETRATFGGRRRLAVGLWSVGAAAAVALIAIAVSLLSPPERPSSRFRDIDVGAVRSLVNDDETLARDDFLLRWSAASEGSRYELRITDERLRLVYRARGLERAEHRVPESALQDLPPGIRLLWQVDVLDATGGRTTSPSYFDRVE